MEQRAAPKGKEEANSTRGKPEYRGDVDNRVKALQDCLSLAGIIQDDRT